MEEKPLSRNTDPFTSHIAPSSKTTRDTIRKNLLTIFKKYGYLTDEQLVAIYNNSFDFAPATDQGIRTRRSELVREGLVDAKPGEFGVTKTGRRCIIWELKK